MNPHFIVEESRERHQFLLEAAEAQRLVHEAQATSRRPQASVRPSIMTFVLRFRARLETWLSVGTPVAQAEEIW